MYLVSYQYPENDFSVRVHLPSKSAGRKKQKERKDENSKRPTIKLRCRKTMRRPTIISKYFLSFVA